MRLPKVRRVKFVHYAVEQGIATLTLDSPHNRNALSAQLRTELRDGLAKADADDTVRVIVLSHTGPVFCSGMDLKETDPQGLGVREFPEILAMIANSPKPVVARLAGSARAGGIGLVASCDIAVATKNATFAFSEVRLGLVPAVISVPLLARLLPTAAHELFLTGAVFDAEQAVHIGLLNAAVDTETLDVEVTKYTDMLKLGGPAALAATKALLREGTSASVDDYAAMLELSARHFTSAEGREGIAAFGEKRRPSWTS